MMRQWASNGMLENIEGWVRNAAVAAACEANRRPGQKDWNQSREARRLTHRERGAQKALEGYCTCAGSRGGRKRGPQGPRWLRGTPVSC